MLADRDMTIKVNTSGRWGSSRKGYDDRTQHFDNDGGFLCFNKD